MITLDDAMDVLIRGGDWDDPNDRLAMVRDGGYYCNEDAFYPDDCAECSGKDYCSRYEEYLEEEIETDD